MTERAAVVNSVWVFDAMCLSHFARADDWIKVARLDTLDEIRLFALWTRRLGSGERDLGEASVFAAAELRSATAITDDPAPVRVARTHGPECTWHHMATRGHLPRR